MQTHTEQIIYDVFKSNNWLHRLEAMGQAMALNLIRAGYALYGFDLDDDRILPCATAGAQSANSATEVVQQSEVIFTSLTDSAVSVQVIEYELLPVARAEQLFICTGTVIPHEIERLPAAFGA